jgi:pimeloyl-ACP methyl ester carboxylesterase
LATFHLNGRQYSRKWRCFHAFAHTTGAGYGGSDPGAKPRTSERISEELHNLLEMAGEKPPYLLVGHSFGGYNVRVFNGRFPREVSGIILVDSVQEDQYKTLPPVWNQVGADLRKHFHQQAKWAPILVGLGIERLLLRSKGQDDNSYLYLQSKYLSARADELDHITVSAEQARAAGPIGDKPLIVLTAGRKPRATPSLSDRDLDDYQQIWIHDLQPRLVRLSCRGKQRIIEESGHDIPSQSPDSIVTAIREIRE